MEYRREFSREYRREANRGNYVVVLTYFFGAIGFAYGTSQIIASYSAETGIGSTALLALMVGAVWGVLGLIFGAMIGAAISGGLWSIPIILLLVLAFQSHLGR
jgi:hypothetical protein